LENLKGTYISEDLVRIILKCALNKYGGCLCGLASSGSHQWLMLGLCERGCKKGVEFHEQVSDCYFFQEGLQLVGELINSRHVEHHIF
jgi:hypothetical protein